MKGDLNLVVDEIVDAIEKETGKRIASATWRVCMMWDLEKGVSKEEVIRKAKEDLIKFETPEAKQKLSKFLINLTEQMLAEQMLDKIKE